MNESAPFSPMLTPEALLAPLTIERFVSTHWEQEPLHVRASERDRYGDLLSTRDFDRLISEGLVGPRDARIVKEGAPDAARPLFRRDGRANIAVVHAAYADGYTVVLNNLQQRRAQVAHLCRAWERALGQQVGANAYLTPPRSRGLAAHFDEHDVYVLQCEGSKVWQIYPAPIALPLSDQHFDVAPDAVGAAICEVCLTPGDLLYIPRGFVHAATSTDERSLHLTLGSSPYRLYDVLAKALFRLAREDVALRRATPPGIERDETWRRNLRASLQTVAGTLADSLDLEAAMHDVRSDLIHGMHALPDATLDSLDALDGLSLQTRVRKRAGAACCLLEEGDTVVLQFPGNAMSAPRGAREALEQIAQQSTFVVGDLPASLTDEAKLTLTKRLIALGLLTRV